MIVIKRDGREVPFDQEKIAEAIRKAYAAVGEDIWLDDDIWVANEIYHKFLNSPVDKMPISDIQDQVELLLMQLGSHKVAKAYIAYRTEHDLKRKDEPYTPDVTNWMGRVEPFSKEILITSIKKAIGDLNLNPELLYAAVRETVTPGMHVNEIGANLIECAKRLCTPNTTAWSIVAGRFVTYKRWGMDRKCRFRDYFELMKGKVWSHPNFNLYSAEDVAKIESFLVPERDLQHSYASVIAAEKKYLHKNERIQHMFLGNAMVIAGEETPEFRLWFLKATYDSLSLRTLSLATPWGINLRANGNISSCFIIEPNDDIGSIFDNAKNEALISKSGGGVGISLARLRAKGSDLMGAEGSATGVTGWIKIYNDVALYVNQGGKRKGAATLALPVWHADIIDFLDIQSEVGDLRAKAYDIEPQITVPDVFMHKQIAKEDWYTFCPHEVKTKLGLEIYAVFDKDFEEVYERCVKAKKDGLLKVGQQINARTLFKHVMKRMFETGMPYIAFIDEINRCNPNKHMGTIPCVNLCTESFSVVVPDELNHCCNLGSLVVGRIPEDRLEHETRLLTRILDNGIELSTAPTKETKRHNKLFRTIGIGIQGLHDKLALENKSYNDLKYITGLAERIMYYAISESIELARERGAYPAFEGSEWANGNMINRFKHNSVLDLDWDKQQQGIDMYGIRNSQLVSPAPNSSTSVLMDASAGIMPTYSAFFLEDNAQGKTPVFPMHLELNPLSYARTQAKHDQVQLTKVVGALQKFVDTGISAEYILDKEKPGFKAKDLYDIIVSAWKEKNKAVYYIRTKKEDKNSDDICVGCAG